MLKKTDNRSEMEPATKICDIYGRFARTQSSLRPESEVVSPGV